MSLIDHFALIAPIYDRVFKSQGHKRLNELADLPEFGVFLDAGGGTGRVAQYIKQPNSHVIVADSSEKMLEQSGLKEGLINVCSQTEYLPFRNESFERIIMVDALHHVYDHQQTVKELYRVVKFGGKIVIEEPNIKRIPVKIIAFIEKIALMRSKFITPIQLKSFIDNEHARVKIEKEKMMYWVIIEK